MVGMLPLSPWLAALRRIGMHGAARGREADVQPAGRALVAVEKGWHSRRREHYPVTW